MNAMQKSNGERELEYSSSYLNGLTALFPALFLKKALCSISP